MNRFIICILFFRWALPDQMAQAGFYHQPNATGDDRIMCFTCNVCLVCWEPTDEPWSEHERHSPACPFVKGEYTQNVPLSVILATAPAREAGDTVDVISTTNVSGLVATASSGGFINVWNVTNQLKVIYNNYNNDNSNMLIDAFHVKVFSSNVFFTEGSIILCGSYRSRNK